tara:strand:+ start:12419 stop:12775 length:357 start_codon:yes stop_codon:yes gene_type:complete
MKQFIKEVNIEKVVKNISLTGFVFSVFTNDKGDSYLSDLDVMHNVEWEKVKKAHNDNTFEELVIFEAQKEFPKLLEYIEIEGLSDLSNQTDLIFNFNTNLKNKDLNEDTLREMGFSSI